MIVITLIALGSASINAQLLHVNADSAKFCDFINPFDIDLFDYDRESESQKSEDDPENKATRKKEETPDQEPEGINQITIEV